MPEEKCKDLMWYRCHTCGGKLIVIKQDTMIRNLPFKCKHCKRINLINLEPLSRE